MAASFPSGFLKKAIYPVLFIGATAVIKRYVPDKALGDIRGVLGKVQTDLALMKLDNKQMALDKKQKALDIQSLLARQDNFERKTTSRIREGLTSMKK